MSQTGTEPLEQATSTLRLVEEPRQQPNPDEADLYVSDAEGTLRRIGYNNKRTKLYNKAGKQVTKSCHVCQDQHVKFKCRGSKACSYSFCYRCLQKYHETLSIRDARNACPVCRAICSCRACLRKMCNPHLQLTQTPKSAERHAKQILRCCGPIIKDLLERDDEEAQQFGWTVEDVEVVRTLDAFITCDRCSASIPDLHFCCGNCRRGEEGGKEICMDCIRECRSLGEFALKQALTCGTCLNSLLPVRMLSKSMLKELRRIAKQFGDEADRPMIPMFTYLSHGPSYISLDIHCDERYGYTRLEFIVQKPLDWKTHVKTLQARAMNVRIICKNEIKRLKLSIEKRDAGNGNSIRCIDAKDCSEKDVYHFLRLCIWNGEPCIVKNAQGVMDWRPQTMTRVFVDRRNQLKSGKRNRRRQVTSSEEESTDEEKEVDPNYVCVIHCRDDWPMHYQRQSDFFNEYERGTDESMFKIKDWPPDTTFREKLTRHYQDFIEMLPFGVYTNPVSGMLNMTTSLPEYRCRPDLGPKTYVATGRQEERNDNTDSVTKLHLDMADAFNILLHAQEKHPDDAKKCGAVWTVVARKDIATVTEYLRNPSAISKKKTYLTKEDRENLVRNHDVHMWTFEQFLNDAVYVPSGCPHQVRNARSCLKVAIDFFPPESAGVVNELVQYKRRFAKRVKNNPDMDVSDVLQSHATMIYASCEALRIKEKRKKEFDVVQDNSPRKWRKVEESK